MKAVKSIAILLGQRKGPRVFLMPNSLFRPTSAAIAGWVLRYGCNRTAFSYDLTPTQALIHHDPRKRHPFAR
jgi:hypothetical protein